jgi:PAS domain S-box-containing protein
MKSNLTIKSRIFLVFTALIACSYALLFWVTFKTVQSSHEDQTAKGLEYSLKFAKNQFSARQELVIGALKLPAATRSVQQLFLSADQKELNNFARFWCKSLDFLEIVTIFDARHNVLARENGRRDPEFFLKKEVLHSLFERKQPIISVELIPHDEYCREVDTDVCQTLTQDKAVMVQFVFLPVIDGAGNVIGAIIAGDEVNREPYLPFLQQKIYDAHVETLVTQQGELIASTMTDSGRLKLNLDPRVMQSLRKGYSFQGSAALNGHQYEMIAEPINNYKGELIGAIAVALRKERFGGLAHENYRTIIFSGLFGNAVIVILGFWIARQFTVPVRRFSDAMKAIAAGDYSIKIPEKGSREFHSLAESFNRMTGSLSQREAVLARQNSELRERNELLENKVLLQDAQLKAETSGYKSIIKSLFDGLVVADNRQTVIEINPAAEKLLGVKARELICEPLAKLYTLPGLGDLEELVIKSRAYRCAGNEPVCILTYNGRNLRFTATAVSEGEVSNLSILLGVRDVTTEGEVDRLKSGFIAKVSHELKTPLTSMKGSLQFILKKGKWLTGVEREMLTVCCRNTERLINLVGGIIELSRIEAGQIAFTMKPVQIGEVVLYALEEAKGTALIRNISLINDVPMDLPKVIGDYERLMQMLSNLLSNAIKFSPENSVVTLGATVDKDVLTITVADDGKVIPEEERAALFSTFQQMGRPEEGEFCGSGLGLAICREILERHNGSIFYTPGAGKGNVFAFSLTVHGEGNGAEQDTYC